MLHCNGMDSAMHVLCDISCIKLIGVVYTCISLCIDQTCRCRLGLGDVGVLRRIHDHRAEALKIRTRMKPQGVY
jgi:hypothetical protein